MPSSGTNATAKPAQYPVINPFKRFRVACIPEGICRYRGLSPGAKLVYGRLERYAGRKGVAFPHIPDIAEEVGLGERQTKEYIYELVDKGFLLVHRIFAKGNTYQFLAHPSLTGDVEETLPIRRDPAQQEELPIRRDPASAIGRDPALQASPPSLLSEESHTEESQERVPPTPSFSAAEDPEQTVKILRSRFGGLRKARKPAKRDVERIRQFVEANPDASLGWMLSELEQFGGQDYWHEYQDQVGAWLKQMRLAVRNGVDCTSGGDQPTDRQMVEPDSGSLPPIAPRASVGQEMAIPVNQEWTPERLVERWAEAVPASGQVDVLDLDLRKRLEAAGADADFQRVFSTRCTEAQGLLAANGEDLSWLDLDWLVSQKNGRKNWAKSLNRFKFKAKRPEQALTPDELRMQKAEAMLERFRAENKQKREEQHSGSDT